MTFLGNFKNGTGSNAVLNEKKSYFDDENFELKHTEAFVKTEVACTVLHKSRGAIAPIAPL